MVAVTVDPSRRLTSLLGLESDKEDFTTLELDGCAPLDIYYVDPNPSINYELGRSSNLEVISENATTGVRKVVNKLMTSFRN